MFLRAVDSHPVDLVRALSLPVPSLVICEMLGVPYRDHEFFQSRTAAMVNRTVPAAHRLRAYGELRAYLADLVAHKEPGDDLCGWVVTPPIATFSVATRETTVSTVEKYRGSSSTAAGVVAGAASREIMFAVVS